jgi:hypothetical protein
MGLLGKVTEAGTAIIGEVSAIAAGKKIPKKVKTLKNITISIVTLGTRYKIARASTGQETIPEIISDVKTQNLNLITKIIADNDLGLPTTILEWESDNESNNSTPSSDVNISSIPDNNVPFDGRLVYLVDDKSGNVLMSLQANVEKEMVDGFVSVLWSSIDYELERLHQPASSGRKRKKSKPGRPREPTQVL